MAAYRFLDNPEIGLPEILSGHKQATLDRIQRQAVVLLVQDTTFLDYGTTQPKTGMGTVKVKKREEYLLHPTVAFIPERVNLGVLGAKWWQRPAQPVAQARKRMPIEEKESYRWLEGWTLACEVKQICPATLVVNVAIGKAISTSGLWTRCAVLLGHEPTFSSEPSAIAVLPQARNIGTCGQQCVRRSRWAASLVPWPVPLRGHRVSSRSP